MNIQEKIEKFTNSFIISDDKTQMNSLLNLIDGSGSDLVSQSFRGADPDGTNDTLEYLFKQNIPGFIDKLKLVRGLYYMEDVELKKIGEKYEFMDKFYVDGITNKYILEANPKYTISLK